MWKPVLSAAYHVRSTFMPPNGRTATRAVWLAAPRAAPVLQLHQLLRRFVDEELDRVLVGQPVAAGDRVVEMLVEAVVRLDHAGRAALRRRTVWLRIG